MAIMQVSWNNPHRPPSPFGKGEATSRLEGSGPREHIKNQSFLSRLIGQKNRVVKHAVIPSEARDLAITAEPARLAVAPYQPGEMLGRFAKYF